jgi:ribonuclease HI
LAVEGTRWAKNPKTKRIRELLDQEKGRVKLMWIPSHSGFTGNNERADEAAKNALEDDNDRKLYPPQDLINWPKKTDAKNRQEKKAQGENTSRFRKETIE